MGYSFRHDVSFLAFDGPALCMECYTSSDSVEKCCTCYSVACFSCLLEPSVRWKHEICRPFRGINDQG